jgi:hypothetical protein
MSQEKEFKNSIPPKARLDPSNPCGAIDLFEDDHIIWILEASCLLDSLMANFVTKFTKKTEFLSIRHSMGGVLMKYL